ncbi:MAG: hypothetical protein JHC57_17060 [Sphingopyxis sp.]|uniref:hypothetical protein n=1 Tax=Sphingopyxis sp. TaxID=1908224 RepID=UPI001A34D43C|nr:hypothetical protein [Sphingopyxis sp.]MBJ7501469.1 hypothetical protein [Sphingopyxis sp.]
MTVVRAFGAALADYLRRSFGLFVIGPAVVALVFIPELLQHVAEIHLGMFDSLEKGRALGDHPLRMGFGYLKIAGLVLAFVASARFWWCRTHGGRWYDVRQVAWGRLILGFVLFMAIGSAGELFPLLTDRKAPVAVPILFSLLSLPFLFVMLAGLFGDRATPMKPLVTRSWPWLLLLAVLAPLGFAPLSWLHGMNHRWALGAHDALVWALMLFDAFVVALMASSIGAALFVAYDRFFQSRKIA